MECFNCNSKPCICQECTDARNNGRHCAKLISPVPNPHPLGTELHSNWDLGFKEGKVELKTEFEQWKRYALR